MRLPSGPGLVLRAAEMALAFGPNRMGALAYDDAGIHRRCAVACERSEGRRRRFDPYGAAAVLCFSAVSRMDVPGCGGGYAPKERKGPKGRSAARGAEGATGPASQETQ